MRTSLKITATIFEIFFIIVIWCSIIYANNSRDSLKECNKIIDIEERLNCIGNLLLKSDSESLKVELFNSLIGYWIKRDGAMGYALSDIFLEILEDDPHFFLSQMKKYGEQFNEWLDRLQYLSFTWHLDPPSPLPEKKAKLIDLIIKFKPTNDDEEVLQKKFLKKLKSITPRQID
ncbi:MAG: hypothetical protein ACFFD2_30505 [Promethearchaeota archaeon]